MAEQASPSGFEISTSPFGLHVVGQDLADPAWLGARWSRMMILWKWVESGPGRWQGDDKAVATLNRYAAAGIQPLPRIISANP